MCNQQWGSSVENKMTANLLAISLTKFASSNGHMMKDYIAFVSRSGFDVCITLLIFRCHLLILPEHQSRISAIKKLSLLNTKTRPRTTLIKTNEVSGFRSRSEKKK